MKRQTRIYKLIRRLESKELQEVKKELNDLQLELIEFKVEFNNQKMELFGSPEKNIEMFNKNPYISKMPQKISLEHRIKTLEK